MKFNPNAIKQKQRTGQYGRHSHLAVWPGVDFGAFRRWHSYLRVNRSRTTGTSRLGREYSFPAGALAEAEAFPYWYGLVRLCPRGFGATSFANWRTKKLRTGRTYDS
ncbi:hypothetical protein JXQ70_16710, partial [bacterium]|nr:hypothetical protein [bacterium]